MKAFVARKLESLLLPLLSCPLFLLLSSVYLFFMLCFSTAENLWRLFSFSLLLQATLPLCYSFFSPSSSIFWFCSPSPIYTILSWSLSLSRFLSSSVSPLFFGLPFYLNRSLAFITRKNNVVSSNHQV